MIWNIAAGVIIGGGVLGIISHALISGSAPSRPEAIPTATAWQLRIGVALAIGVILKAALY